MAPEVTLPVPIDVESPNHTGPGNGLLPGARVDVNRRDTIVPTNTERSARGLPVPPRELAMLNAMRSVHLRERLAVGRPLTDADLLLSRVDGTWLPVREYSREFAAQRTAAGLEAITLGKLRHSNISRMRAAGIAADVVAAWHGHTERMTQAVYGRVTDDRPTAAADVFSSAAGQIWDTRRPAARSG
jgi:integrase